MKKRLILALTTFVSASYATNASPVPISSVARSANVVTVTCSSACGISPTFGFCIAGVTDTTFNVCGVAVTGSGTSYTFNQTAANGSSSGGTSTAAKQIIFLGTQTNGQEKVVSYLLWNYTLTPLAQSNGSTWPLASTNENNAIKAGLFVETSRSAQFANTANQGQIDQQAQNDWLTTQNSLVAGIQPGTNNGCFCDPVGCGC